MSALLALSLKIYQIVFYNFVYVFGFVVKMYEIINLSCLIYKT